MSTMGSLDNVIPQMPEEQIAKMVFQALQTDLVAQLQAGLAEMQGRMDVLETRLAALERGDRGAWQRPSISPPEKYDGALRTLVDWFISQVEATAKFETFWDKKQKVLWAQLYLTGSALAWSQVITTGLDDPDLNLRCFEWGA